MMGKNFEERLHDLEHDVSRIEMLYYPGLSKKLDDIFKFIKEKRLEKENREVVDALYRIKDFLNSKV